MREVRLTPQAVKDLTVFDELTRKRIKNALRHLAQHPLDGKPLQGKFQKDKVWSYRFWPYRILYWREGANWLDALSLERRKGVYR